MLISLMSYTIAPNGATFILVIGSINIALLKEHS